MEGLPTRPAALHQVDEQSAMQFVAEADLRAGSQTGSCRREQQLGGKTACQPSRVCGQTVVRRPGGDIDQMFAHVYENRETPTCSTPVDMQPTTDSRNPSDACHSHLAHSRIRIDALMYCLSFCSLSSHQPSAHEQQFPPYRQQQSPDRSPKPFRAGRTVYRTAVADDAYNRCQHLILAALFHGLEVAVSHQRKALPFYLIDTMQYITFRVQPNQYDIPCRNPSDPV